MNHCESCSWEEIAKDLESRLIEREKECQEQARLLGMSGSREAKLLAEVARLNDTFACMEEAKDKYYTECERYKKVLEDIKRHIQEFAFKGPPDLSAVWNIADRALEEK